jgi:hypothetical protein
VQVVVDVALDDDNEEMDGDGEWPFAPFVELLIHDMFDPGYLSSSLVMNLSNSWWSFL